MNDRKEAHASTIPSDSDLVRLSTFHLVGLLMQNARRNEREAEVAYYLVGASLQLTFPALPILQRRYTTGNSQSGNPGDFNVGDTVFYVSAAPSLGLFQKCVENLHRGYRVYVLVTDRALVATRQLAELTAPGQISCQSIESFVGLNIDKLSRFSKRLMPDVLRNLLDTYNTRVNAVELDKSLLIDVPRNLAE